MTNSVERELTKILDSIVDDLIYQSKKKKRVAELQNINP